MSEPSSPGDKEVAKASNRMRQERLEKQRRVADTVLQRMKAEAGGTGDGLMPRSLPEDVGSAVGQDRGHAAKNPQKGLRQRLKESKRIGLATKPTGGV